MTKATLRTEQIKPPVYRDTVVLEMSKKEAAYVMTILGSIVNGSSRVYTSLRELLNPDFDAPHCRMKLYVNISPERTNWINSFDDGKDNEDGNC